MLNLDELLYERFIVPMEKRRRRHGPELVGMEAEYPLEAVHDASREAMRGLLPALCARHGFRPVSYWSGEPAVLSEVELPGAGVVSFDTSWHNLELAMAPVPDLFALKANYKLLLAAVQAEIAAGGAKLLFTGIHPEFRTLPPELLPDDELPVECTMLRSFSGEDYHGYDGLFSFIASAQTHLDVVPEELPALLNVFSALDFAECLLFADSAAVIGGKWRPCARLWLYEHCALRTYGLSGGYDQPFASLPDIFADYRRRAIFVVRREGRCVALPAPALLAAYFSRPEARAEDLESFYSYRHTELKPYGTIERRVACAQVPGRTFQPTAFALGVRHNAAAAGEAVARWRSGNGMTASNNELCQLAANEGMGAFPAGTYAMLLELWEIAREGLQKRQRGEEVFLPEAGCPERCQ